MPDFSVFDITKDLPTTKIDAEKVIMSIESNIVSCGVEASGK